MEINDILKLSVQRANRRHNGNFHEWSPLEWAGAMAGEAGEAANWAKKLKRLESQIASINEPGRHATDIEEVSRMVCKEVADTILYGVLLAARVGCYNLEGVIQGVFNQKSEEYGFQERIYSV